MVAYYLIDDDNIDEARVACVATDQRAELTVGDETWGFLFGSQRGQISRYRASGRGAIATGGDSCWGDWITFGRDAPQQWLKGHQILALDGGDYWVTEDGALYEAGTGEPIDDIPPQ